MNNKIYESNLLKAPDKQKIRSVSTVAHKMHGPWNDSKAWKNATHYFLLMFTFL